MRTINHSLSESKTGKCVSLKIQIDDRFGKNVIVLSSVKGWRKDFALCNLPIDDTNLNEWNDVTNKVYLSLQVLKCAKDKEEAVKFFAIMKTLSKLEIHFWSNKFFSNKKTKGAWRALYV